MLTHWAMGRDRGERIPLERIVRRQTHDTARMYGLDDRGVLAAGFLADVLVVDLDRLALEPPELVFDLPAQGRRLAQRAREAGVAAVPTLPDGGSDAVFRGALVSRGQSVAERPLPPALAHRAGVGGLGVCFGGHSFGGGLGNGSFGRGDGHSVQPQCQILCRAGRGGCLGISHGLHGTVMAMGGQSSEAPSPLWPAGGPRAPRPG